MSSVRHHVVRSQILEAVVTGSESDGFVLQRRLAELGRGALMAALDETLTRAVPDGEHWIFDRLDVDAGVLALDTLERDLVGAVTAAVERRIRQAAVEAGVLRRAGPQSAEEPGDAGRDGRTADDGIRGGSTARRLSGAQSLQQVFLHVLRTGVLPWWCHLAPGERLEDAIAASWSTGDAFAAVEAGLPDIIRVLIESTDARVRLARQFSTAFLDRLLRRLSPAMAETVAWINAKTASATPADTGRKMQQRLWQAAFLVAAARPRATVDHLFDEWTRAAAADGSAERDAIAHCVATWPEAAATPASAAVPDHSEPGGPVRPSATGAGEASDSGLDLDEGIFVDDAGLVLLHPFLPALFERLGVAADDRLREPDRALALLHFLATGATSAPEYLLIVPKLLCGLPLDEPAPAPVELTEEDREEATALLAAVLGHWDALADASPDALRGTFLTRPGKLSMRGGDWLLQVEPQSFDVLLDRLPWGIGAIRLPWMARLLWVEWRL